MRLEVSENVSAVSRIERQEGLTVDLIFHEMQETRRLFEVCLYSEFACTFERVDSTEESSNSRRFDPASKVSKESERSTHE